MRTEFVGVKLSRSERDVIEAVAEMRGCSLSELVRTAAVDGARRWLTEQGQQPARSKQEMEATDVDD